MGFGEAYIILYNYIRLCRAEYKQTRENRTKRVTRVQD